MIKLDADSALAHNGRGHAYRLQGDFDRAIADDSDAIKRDPKLPSAFIDRGWGYSAKGDFDRAVADFSQAVQLDPKSSSGYSGRGFAYFLAGAPPKALADLTQANALSPADAYPALLLEIVGRRNNLPSRLGEMSEKLDMAKWPAPVVRLYLGQLTAAATLAAADDPDPLTKRGRVCEATVYSGELALLDGKRDDAARLLTEASGDCPLAFGERQLADAELKAIGIIPPQTKP